LQLSFVHGILFSEVIALDITKPFEAVINDFQEMHINIEDAHFTLLADHGIDMLGCRQIRNLSPMHFHAYYEVFYVRGGELTVNFEHDSTVFNKDSLVILRPQVPHSSTLKSADSSRYCFGFFIERNNLKTERSLYDILVMALSGNTNYIYIPNGISVYESLHRITESIPYGNSFKLSSHFYEFILAFLDLVGTLQPNSPEELLANSSVSRTYKLQRIISSYYKEDISLNYLAKSLCLSTRQVNRIVQSFYGCTYREIITQTKLKAAAELLRTSDMTISEISVNVGYQSLRGFYSAFKKHYGCLPTEYRKSL